MKNLNNIKAITFILSSVLAVSCVQDNLDPDNAPGVGGIEDLTPPEADFSFQQDVEDFTVFFFTNESVSSTRQTWSIPSNATLVEGFSLSDQNIEVKFPGEGEFVVGLTATDERPASSEELVQTIEVIEPEVPLIPTPVILAGDFEEDPDGAYADVRNVWGRSGASDSPPGLYSFTNWGLLQTSTGSPGSRVRSGFEAGKLPQGSERMAYQEIEVTPGASYGLTVWIKRGADFDLEIPDDEEFRIAIMGETFEEFDLAAWEESFIAVETVTPQGEDWQRVSLVFEADSETTQVAIYFDSKARVDVQVDDMEIQVR